MDTITKGWSKETAHPSYQNKWSTEKPSVGQCAITAMYLNQKYGYPIYEVMVGKSRHFFNKDKEGNIVDLTKDQFNGDISYTHIRERQFKDLYKSCKSRYDKFISNLGETLNEAKKGYLDDEGKFFDFRTREVEGNNFIDDHKTGVPYYDDFLNPERAKDLEEYENLKGEIVMMSPKEYYQECAENIFDKKPSVDALIRQRGEYDRDIIEHLKEVLLKYKKRFPMPYLNYTGSKGQEGLHRMLCLAELTSWDTKFPVLVITYADQERADRVRKEKEIAKFRVKIRSALQDALRYKYANIDEFKEQLQYSLDREWEWMDLPSPTFTLEDDGEYYVVKVGEADEDFLKSSIKIEEKPEFKIDEDDLDIDDINLEETEDFLKRYFGDDWRTTHPYLKDTFHI